MHVLLLEPDKNLSESYIEVFRSNGHTISWAKTAQGAVLEADEKQPDVVVLELQIARHNGIEFLYEFVSYPEWQSIPVVILTVLLISEVKKMTVLRDQLSVVKVLSKTHTDLKNLVAQAEEAASQA